MIRFRELLGFFQLNRNYFSIAQILRAFSEQFNYREILWSQPNAGQRLANLEKLLDQADQFTAKGYHDLYRFLDYLEQLQEAEVLEGEAPTQAEMGAAVRLMTIHRAKGLEFPVVILPDLDRQFLTLRERLIWHKDCGIEAGLSVTDGKIGWSILGKAIRERHQRENLAEMKRLFYVALTRAEERLVLVGSGCSRSKADSLASADSWMKWLELLLPLAEQTGPFDYQGVPLLITREVPEAVRPAPRGTLLEEYLAQPTAAPLDLAVATSTPVNSAADSATTVLKVSEFLAFQACPRRYYWEYRWRLSQQATLGSEGATELGGALGRFAGEFFHRAARLQQPEWPETLWQRLSRELSPADRQLLKPDLLQMWQNFRASGYTEQAGRCWDEVPFQIKLQKGLAVEGRFDRLLEKSSQMRTLVDYKTHRIKAAAVAELGPAYFSQLQLYALAVAVLWGELPGTAMLYFPYSDQGIAVPLNEVDRERVRSEVAAMADFISQHQLPQEYPATGDCRRCGYQSLCRSDS